MVAGVKAGAVTVKDIKLARSLSLIKSFDPLWTTIDIPIGVIRWVIGSGGNGNRPEFSIS